MAGWTRHRGQVVHLPFDNIDTDQLIPARFMSVPRSDGYGPYLMHDMRRGDAGALLQDFPLNKQPEASILIAGGNFGSGSSREAAVYALVDAGFRVVIAPGFGDIFAGNAVNNGLLPAALPQHEIDQLVAAMGASNLMQIDMDTGITCVGNAVVDLKMDETQRQKLINGWDDIDLTMREGASISRYRKTREAQAWVWPKAGT